MLKTIMQLRSRRRSLCFPLRDNHLLPSPPTLWHKSRAKRHVQLPFHSSMSSLYGMRVVAVGEWVPARAKTVWGHLWHQKEQEEAAQAVNSNTKQLATSVAKVQMTLGEMVCAMRMWIKTGCGGDRKCIDRTPQQNWNCKTTCTYIAM